MMRETCKALLLSFALCPPWALAATPIVPPEPSGASATQPVHSTEQSLTHLAKTLGGASSDELHLRKTIVDADRLHFFGFVGDGKSHPLSSIKAFHGASTVKWTLAQWKLVLPAATALSDEIDWLALQSFINAATGPTIVALPPGSNAIVNHPLASGCHAISYQSYGILAAKLTQTVFGAGLLDHASPDSACPVSAASEGANFEIQNLSLQCAVNGCGPAIKARLAPGTGELVLDKVTFGGAPSGGFFTACGAFTNASLSYLNHVDCKGNYGGAPGSLLTVGDAFSWASGPTYPGAGTGSYYISLHDVNVRFMQRCFVFATPPATRAFTGGIEGVEGSGLNCTAALDGLVIDNKAYSAKPSPAAQARYYRAPQWFFHDSQWEVSRYLVNATHIADLRWHHNLAYLDASAPSSISGAVSSGDLILLIGLADAQFDHDVYVIKSQAFNALFHVAGASDIGAYTSFDHESVSLDGAPPAAGIFVVNAGTTNVLERDTIYSGSQKTFTKVVNSSTDPTVRMESQFTPLGAALLSDGTVSFTSTAVGVPDSDGRFTVTMPRGLFLSAPKLAVTNGDYDIANAGCGLALNTAPTATSFVARCANTPSKAAVRVNYTALGR